MKRQFVAVLTSAALLGGAAFAQESSEMTQGFDMLNAALVTEFDKLRIPTETLEFLSLGQIATIKQIIDSGDIQNKKARIEAVMGIN